MVWTLREWEDEWDAIGKIIKCNGVKDSASSPFIEFRIEGTFAGYHVHVKSREGANIEVIRYKSNLADHAGGRNIMGKEKHEQRCNFKTIIFHLKRENYLTTANMVERLQAAYNEWQQEQQKLTARK